MWKWTKQKTNVTNQSNRGGKQTNTIKDGININIEKDRDSLIKILINIKEEISLLKQDGIKFHDDLLSLKKAFSIYVENNGVKPEIKKIVKELLRNN